jgi:hypothetical protein
MSKKIKGMGIVIVIMAVICFLIGVTFIAQGFIQRHTIIADMDEEKVPMNAFGGDPDNIMDSLQDVQIAADMVREHRHEMAPSYAALLKDKDFNPKDPEQLIYAQAMNLENSLDLVVLSFGMIQVIMATGGFMIISAVVFGLTGGALIYTSPNLRFTQKPVQ